MKKTIVFDLDGTLAESKSALTDRMSDLLSRLLENFHVCVISGGNFAQYEKQLLANLHVDATKLEHLHLMPTCGTRYYIYDISKDNWKLVYAEDLNEEEKQKIISALNEAVDHCGYRLTKPWGELIEDRGSQITYSALGQAAPVKAKEEWDPENTKKKKLRDYTATLIPEFEVRSGGTTSIDVTKLGIDKAYGMKKLMSILDLNMNEILFMGDRLSEGGNDYPVKAMGIDSIEVSSWKDTAVALEAILHVI
ncbi:MAG: HAD-IIB family hydrolase [Candidatus Saccharimonadales bacterium]